jgi:hypothetical protein
MSEENFRSYYGTLPDDELQQVLDDKKDLLPEAAAALEEEAQKRKLRSAEPPKWKPLPDTSQQVHCLEDYPEYRALIERRRLVNRYALPIAIAPFFLGFALARKATENSDAFAIFALGWAMIVGIYSWSILVRWFRYECPQCGETFGRGGACFYCGFPRNTAK